MKSRRPLLGVTIFFMAGIIVQFYGHVPFWVGGIFVFLCLALCVVFFTHERLCSSLILAAWFFLGGLVFENARYLAPQDISRVIRYYRGRDILLEGVVISDPEVRDFRKTQKTTFALSLRYLKTNRGWQPKTGTILVSVFGPREFGYGDMLRLQGKIYPAYNFKTDNQFSYKDYLARRGIYVLMSIKKSTPMEVLSQGQGYRVKAFAIDLKNRAKGIFEKSLWPNETALMQAIILGDRYQIPKHIRELFVVTGTAHILAISGLHVGIVAFIIFLFLKILPIPRRARPSLAIVILVFYALLTGARPSVVRATIMATVFLFGFLVERQTDLINSLCLAALVILGLNPQNLFDAGFQLSFISVLSILLLYPMFRSATSGWNVPVALKGTLQALGVSLAVWLGVAGLIAYYFQIVSPVTIIANLFVIPCISVVVALGLGLLFAGAFLPGFIVQAFAVCLKASLNAMVAGVFLFSQIPGASFSLPQIPLYFVWIFYTALGIIMISQCQVFRQFFQKRHENKTA